MKDEYKFNLNNYLLNNNRKQIFLGILVLIILICFITISLVFHVYNIQTVRAKTICEHNECILNFYNSDFINNNYKFVKIKKKQYKIEKIVWAEPFFNQNNILFQEVSLILKDYKGQNNKIIEIEIYKNKDVLMKKIWKILLER